MVRKRLEEKPWEMCSKPPPVRARLYKKKQIKKQRDKMCDEGKYPRCAGKGMYKCVKRRSRQSREEINRKRREARAKKKQSQPST